MKLYDFFTFLAIAFLVIGYNERMNNQDKIDIKKQVESQCEVIGIDYKI